MVCYPVGTSNQKIMLSSHHVIMASNNAKVGYGIDIILKGGGVICAHTITLPAAAYKAACFRVVHAKF